MENKHYDCATCVNRNSPLCELCTQILSPSGKERKPKYYIGQVEVEPIDPELKFDSEVERRAFLIAKHLISGLPIPIRIVLEYNKLSEKNIKKEE